MAFNLSAKDAMAVRKEFLEDPMSGDPARPVSLEALVALRPGQAMARLGGGAYALPLRTLDEPPAWRGEKVREASWRSYGAMPISESAAKSPDPNRKQVPGNSEGFLE